jgi:hypothetical protein
LVAGVHDEVLGHFGLVGAEGFGLFEKAIDEGGFAVIDVGDDGDVADEFTFHGNVIKWSFYL